MKNSQESHGNRTAFSICLATYNGEIFIESQLESILTEMRTYDEIVVVDDNSQDRTVEIVDRMLSDHSDCRSTLVQLDNNGGHVAAFATAIRRARNPFITLSDQDDIWPRDRLRNLASHLSSSSADLTFGSLQAFGRGTTLDMVNVDHNYKGRVGLLKFLLGLNGHLYSYGSACAFRRDAINPDIPLCVETHEQWLIAQALARNGVHYMAEVVTLRRLHEANLTARRPLRKRVPAKLRAARGMAHIIALCRNSAQ